MKGGKVREMTLGTKTGMNTGKRADIDAEGKNKKGDWIAVLES